MKVYLTRVSAVDKMRLLMIYIISQEGIKDTDRKKLMDIAKLSMDEQAAISNLRYLGVTLLKGAKSQTNSKVDKKKKKKQRSDAPPYELSRYVPTTKKILEVLNILCSFAYTEQELASDSLSPTDYPSVRKEDLGSEKRQSLIVNNNAPKRSSQPTWASKDKKKTKQVCFQLLSK